MGVLKIASWRRLNTTPMEVAGCGARRMMEAEAMGVLALRHTEPVRRTALLTKCFANRSRTAWRLTTSAELLLV